MPTLLASVSRPQKTPSPTFHVPFCKTAVPLWLLATVWPAAERSYFTVALVAEVSVTEFTLDDTADAIELDENEVIAEENCEPFSSSCTRLLFGVEGLKNVVQLVLISETALAELPPDADVEDGVAGDAGVVAEAEDPGVEEEELELLEQADIAVTSTRPSAGTR
ncbi:MAG TPA: hypothetical protein VFO01_04495 [Trebonia sp.]|nr:hypothetical protein [Trebonia sp.]